MKKQINLQQIISILCIAISCRIVAENLVENIHYNVTKRDLAKNAEEYQKAMNKKDDETKK